MTYYVNKKSGTAHADRQCVGLAGVPDGALRVVQVGSERPRLRFCSYCASPADVSAGLQAGGPVSSERSERTA